jgi:hypothetical protein
MIPDNTDLNSTNELHNIKLNEAIDELLKVLFPESVPSAETVCAP